MILFLPFKGKQKRTRDKILFDAEDCIKIYNKLKEIGEGKVWISCWNALTMPILDKSLPVLGYQPNSVGEIFLKGIDYGDTTI